MEGTNENPDAPRGTEQKVTVTTGPVEKKATGYPIELAQRPITLPANMAEVAIGPHFVAKPYAATDALRARYGITPKIQLGLTYVMYGVYREDTVNPSATVKTYHFRAGKAGGLDVTVLLTNWLGVKAGLPMYFDPFAMSLALGAPMKWQIGDKVAIGAMDDVLNIRLEKFAPSYYHERDNVAAANNETNMTTQSRGLLRFSGYGIYQQQANLALFGRVALDFNDFSANKTSACSQCSVTSIHAGALFSPKKFLDVGASLGFDDLRTANSFALSGYLAARI
jgi:hypothetical protein